jgi:LacI family transcriptional regulator
MRAENVFGGPIFAYSRRPYELTVFRSSGPPTIRDVAAAAGVSLATVSRALNGRTADISEETRSRVLDVAVTLGYRANVSARALRSRVVDAIGFVDSISHYRPFTSEQVYGAAIEASSIGRALLLFIGTEFATVDAVAGILDSRRADGLILFGTGALDDDQLRGLADRIVVIQDRYVRLPSNVRRVILDASHSRPVVMEHLVSLGHRSIAYLSPAQHTGTRLSDFRKGLAEAGIVEELVVFADLSIDSAATAAGELLSAKPDLTAIICATDVLAAGAYQAAARLGRRIPEDLSVVAYDGFSIATALQPQLTAVASPAEEAGRAAVRLLLDVLAGAEPESIALPFPLIVRGSTTAPPGLSSVPEAQLPETGRRGLSPR